MFDPEDLGLYLRADVSIPEADLARTLAEGLIQSETGQRFDVATTTITLAPELADPRKVVLPQMPVRSVVSVEDEDGAPVTGWTLRGQTLLRDSWPEVVTVEYSHGFDVVPQVVRAVALACAARVVSNPSGARSVTVADVSTSYAGSDDDLTSGAYLTEREKQLLAPFRSTRPVVQLS